MATQKAFYSGISLQSPMGMHLENTVPSAPNVVFLAHGSRAACNDFQRIHSRIGNARRDYLHKCSTTISQNHAMVCIEDLQVRNMFRSAAANRQTQALFRCVGCGFEGHADVVGAINVLRAGHARLACEVSAEVMAPAAGTHRSDLGAARCRA